MTNRLRLLRAERNWSQAELAERLGVSRQTVNAIETGKYDPSLPLAFQMADLFGLLIEEIFGPKSSRLESAGRRPSQGAGISLRENREQSGDRAPVGKST